METQTQASVLQVWRGLGQETRDVEAFIPVIRRSPREDDTRYRVHLPSLISTGVYCFFSHCNQSHRLMHILLLPTPLATSLESLHHELRELGCQLHVNNRLSSLFDICLTFMTKTEAVADVTFQVESWNKNSYS